MNAHLQTLIVILMVAAALAYILVKAKKKLTTKNGRCGGCVICGN